LYLSGIHLEVMWVLISHDEPFIESVLIGRSSFSLSSFDLTGSTTLINHLGTFAFLVCFSIHKRFPVAHSKESIRWVVSVCISQPSIVSQRIWVNKFHLLNWFVCQRTMQIYRYNSERLTKN